MPGRKTRDKLIHPVGLRLPPDLFAKLRELSVTEGRSISAQALRALEIYLAHVDECEALRRQDKPPSA
jgi:hypothetical protein